jgi:hypothetical protein
MESSSSKDCDVCSFEICNDPEVPHWQIKVGRPQCTFPCPSTGDRCQREAQKKMLTCFQHTMCLTKGGHLSLGALEVLEKIMVDKKVKNKQYTTYINEAKKCAEKYISVEKNLLREGLRSRTNAPQWIQELLQVVPEDTKQLDLPETFIQHMNVPVDIITLCLRYRDIANTIYSTHDEMVSAATSLSTELNHLDDKVWRHITNMGLKFDLETGFIYPDKLRRHLALKYASEKYNKDDPLHVASRTLDNNRYNSESFLHIFTKSAAFFLNMYVSLDKSRQLWLKKTMVESLYKVRTDQNDIRTDGEDVKREDKNGKIVQTEQGSPYAKLVSLVKNLREPEIKMAQIVGHKAQWQITIGYRQTNTLDSMQRLLLSTGEAFTEEFDDLKRFTQHALSSYGYLLSGLYPNPKLDYGDVRLRQEIIIKDLQRIVDPSYWGNKPWVMPDIDKEYKTFFDACIEYNPTKKAIPDVLETTFINKNPVELARWLTQKTCNARGLFFPKFLLEKDRSDWYIPYREEHIYEAVRTVDLISPKVLLKLYIAHVKNKKEQLSKIIRPVIISTLFKFRVKEEPVEGESQYFNTGELVRKGLLSLIALKKMLTSLDLTNDELLAAISAGDKARWKSKHALAATPENVMIKDILNDLRK